MNAAILVVLLLVLVAAAILYIRHRKAGTCSTAADCPSGQTCVGGLCQTIVGCQPACIAPQVCVGTSCATPSDTCNPACTVPQTCVSGSCVTPAGICYPACAAPLACQNGTCAVPAGVCYPACVSPQTCQNGTCVSPPPSSCYSWAPWGGPGGGLWPGTLSSDDNSQTPAARIVNGKPCLGSTNIGDGTLASTMDGCYGNPPPLQLLARDPACPGSVKTTTDAIKAVQFNGLPVCIGFGDGYQLTPYNANTNTCGGWDNTSFALLLDEVIPS